jgi:hypothetical protein
VKFDGVADAGGGEIADWLGKLEGRGVRRAGAGASEEDKCSAESQIAEKGRGVLAAAAIQIHGDEPSTSVLT